MIHYVEAARPAKTDALAYLDDETHEVPRYAKVSLGVDMRGSDQHGLRRFGHRRI